MIEESGENWWYYTDIEPPQSIQVIARVASVEVIESVERRKKKRDVRKPKPFGFARALPKPKKGES